MKRLSELKKALALLLSAMLICVFAAGCGGVDMSGSGDDIPDYAQTTGSGEPYIATVSDDSATIEYLGATLDINEGEFEDEDEVEKVTYFRLGMSFTNDMSEGTYDDEVDDEYKQDSLDAAFVVQAVQDGEVIQPRGPGETETIEEDNVYEKIDELGYLDCEYYFPVDPSKPVTIQVLNPDGEDTVMAELTYKPEGDEDD